MTLGFSTGSLALDDVQRGITLATNPRTDAIELSALRETELDPLLSLLDALQDSLRPFSYISVHAPSKRLKLTEAELVLKLAPIAERGWTIVVHPDLIEDFSLWRQLGSSVCIENMDKRKQVGCTAAQLAKVFEQLPAATLCFDMGHARQVDPTMQEANTILRQFCGRLRQVHLSHVNSQSGHERLKHESIAAFKRVSGWIDDSVPVILETPVTRDEVEGELTAAEKVFAEGRSVTRQSVRPSDRRNEHFLVELE